PQISPSMLPPVENLELALPLRGFTGGSGGRLRSSRLSVSQGIGTIPFRQAVFSSDWQARSWAAVHLTNTTMVVPPADEVAGPEANLPRDVEAASAKFRAICGGAKVGVGVGIVAGHPHTPPRARLHHPAGVLLSPPKPSRIPTSLQSTDQVRFFAWLAMQFNSWWSENPIKTTTPSFGYPKHKWTKERNFGRFWRQNRPMGW
ncbi:MAG TPA: hypothetical protein PLC86_17630, partial [Candidatus Accumulibacter phosphatis]|nr:hypothetical protein [Candidatus Accumulibacter phosphatis]